MNNIVDLILARLGMVTGTLAVTVAGYHQMLLEHFGEKITIGIYLCALILVLAIVFKIFKLAFNLLRLVIIPSIVAGYVISALSPLNFLAALPVAGAAFSLLFLIKA